MRKEMVYSRALELHRYSILDSICIALDSIYIALKLGYLYHLSRIST